VKTKTKRNMKTTFKPIQIGYQKEYEANHKNNLTALRNHVTAFFNEVSKTVEVADKNAYKGKFISTFLTEFETKYKSSFPPVMSLEKIIQMSDVNVSKLKKIVNDIEAVGIDIDLNTLQEIEPIEFRVYTENEEQNKLFQYAQTICEAMYTNDRPNIHFWNADLVRSFGGLMVYDFGKQQIVPNVLMIKNQMR
jgi:hypothetical protein